MYNSFTVTGGKRMKNISIALLFIVLTNISNKPIRINVELIKFYEEALAPKWGEKATLYIQDGSIIDVKETADEIDMFIQDPLSKGKIIERPKAKD